MDSVTIRELFIFNTNLKSPKKKPSDDEAQDAKLLYYYPESTEQLIKRSNVGIVEGTLSFMQAFEATDSNFLLTELNKTIFIANGYEDGFMIGFIVDKNNSKVFNKYENLDTKKKWMKELLDNFYHSFILFHGKLHDYFLNKEKPEISTPLSKESLGIVRDFVLNYFEFFNGMKIPIINYLQYFPMTGNLQANILLAIQRLSEKLPDLKMTSVVYKGKLIHNQLPFDTMSLFYNIFFSTYETSSKFTTFKPPMAEEYDINQGKNKEKEKEKKEEEKKEEPKKEKKAKKEKKKKKEEEIKKDIEEKKEGGTEEEKKDSEIKESTPAVASEEVKEAQEIKEIQEITEKKPEEEEKEEEDLTPIKTSPYRKVFDLGVSQNDFLVGIRSPNAGNYSIFVPTVYIKELSKFYKTFIYYFNGLIIFLFFDESFNVIEKIAKVAKLSKWINKYFKEQLESLEEAEKIQVPEYSTFCYSNSCNKSIRFAGFVNKKSGNSFDWKMFEMLQKSLFINEFSEMTSLCKFKGFYIYYIHSIGKKVVIFYKDNITLQQLKQEIEKTKKEHFDYVFLN